MELEELQQLIGNYEELQKKIAEERPAVDASGYLKQYDPIQHDVKDTTKRPDKIVESDQGPSTVPVARLPVSLQKQIVNRAATFLCGNPVVLSCNARQDVELAMLEGVEQIWNQNKLDYLNKRIAKHVFSETEAAELWYVEQVGPEFWANTRNQGGTFSMRMKLLAPSLGDKLYPVYNKVGDLIAFGREYTLREQGKEVAHYDLYTDTAIYFGTKTDAGFTVEQQTNVIGKIPVIYYRQAVPDWYDVQDLIDRFEKLISNHADTNDYFGSPMVFVEGELDGFAKKGEQGKVLIGKNGAKAQYLSWDNSPESVKLELENLRSLIYGLTDTPDISFDKVKGLGNYSGIALKMLFLGAHMKASDKEETFGECIQRRINFLKAAMAKINVRLEAALPLPIKPRFEYYLPKNDLEKIDMLVTATGSKPILSRKTAVSLNPLVEDHEAELANLDDEAGTLDDQFNE